MNQDDRLVSVPDRMKSVRFRPPRQAEKPEGEIPLIDPKGPKEQQLKQVWTAKVRVFDMSDAEQLKAYTEIWQQITDGKATVSKEDGPHFDPQTGKFLTFLRWAEFSYKV